MDDDRLEVIGGLAQAAAHHAEIAQRTAERTEAVLLDMKRKEPDENGHPGVLHWLGTELVALRAERRRSMVSNVLVSALVAGAVAATALAACFR